MSSSSQQRQPLQLMAVNHISRETQDVNGLVRFYMNVLGLQKMDRPNFGFGGFWLQLPGGVALHIIERDPEKPTPQQQGGALPERFIRRSEHVALTVSDIEQAKETLKEHGIVFAVNTVPGTEIEQLFFYDPDGNGVEIGNFDI